MPEQVIRGAVAGIQRSHGCAVADVTTAADTLAQLSLQSADLVITDIYVPEEMDGLDLTCWIQTCHPVIISAVLTSHTDTCMPDAGYVYLQNPSGQTRRSSG